MISKFIKIIFFSCFLLSNAILFAQIDSNIGGVKTTLEIPPEIEVEKHEFKDPRVSN